MIRLYLARRTPQAMILIGSVFVIFSLAMGLAHYGFGVPVYDRNTGEPSSDAAIGVLLIVFTGVGLLLALLGCTILRAAARHNLTKSQAGHVREPARSGRRDRST